MPALAEKETDLAGRASLQTRDLAFRPESVREGDRSVLAMICTDAPVLVRDFATWDFIDEVLVAGGARFMPHVPVLGGHRHHHELDVYGHVGAPETVATGHEARLFFSEPANERDPVAIVWQRVKGGHLRGVSVGYDPVDYTDIGAGKSATIGGRQYTAAPGRRLRVTRQYDVYEVSVVPIGADPDSVMRARRAHPSQPPARRRRRHVQSTHPTAGRRRPRHRNA